MTTPNLFDFATSELSQDAVVCWLAAWADPACRAANGPLHATATAFVTRLLEVGRGPMVTEVRSVHVRRQWRDIDVLLVVNGDTAVVIEDKTDTKDHSDQLRRYRAAVEAEFPADRIAAVYLKTGDQCDYGDAERAGYGCFLRRDFLDVLRGESLGVTNDTFGDFHRYLRGIDEAVQSFTAVPPLDWDRRPWIGFVTALRVELGDGEWEVRGHSGGNSLPFRWHWRGDTYLALNEDTLAFKIEVKDEGQQGAKWDEWSRTLAAVSGTAGVRVVPARRKLGKRMTVAILDGDYLQLDERGFLDLARTAGVLRNASALMDAALNRLLPVQGMKEEIVSPVGLAEQT